MRHVVRYSVLIAIVAALTPWAADAQVYPDRIAVKARAAAVAYQRRARDDNREEQTERTTKTFKLGSDGSLDLGNLSGDITVTRGGGSDATVEIIKTAHARTGADAKSQLDLVTVDVNERAGRLEVKTHYPNQMHGNINVSVAYNVTAPAGTRVTANSMSGSIKFTDIKGDVSASTMSGDVRISGASRINSAKSMSGTIEIADVKTDGGIEPSSMSGDVRLSRVVARRISAGSVSGGVRLEDVQAETIATHSISGDLEFSGTLARNGRYEFKSNSGEVHLTLAGNTGFEVDANSFSGEVRSDFPITTHGSTDPSGRRGPRRSLLQGTFGDGSAVISINTFSGSIVIGKK
jgi:DUF4097 and DUF4098 domain-containing protein YvlB